MEIKEGDTISWCDEEFTVLKVFSQDTGTVKDSAGDIINPFHFNFQGEKSKIIRG